MIRVTVISTGSELVNGAVVDTNSAFISGFFFASNFSVIRHITVGDSHNEIFKACRDSLKDSQCVIMTGGLGPTEDDITVDIIAELSGRELVRDKRAMDKIDSFFSETGRTVSESDRNQATVPEECVVFHNTNGLAPGFACEMEDSLFIAMPGVPQEMEKMMTESVLPFLKDRYGFVKHDNLSFKTYGLKESEVNDAVKKIEYIDNRTTWGITATSGIMTVTVVSKSGHILPVKEIRLEAEMLLGDSMLGEGFTGPQEELVFLLKNKGLTISTAESCTGGLIARMITDIPGSSAVFTGSIVAYSNEIKKRFLNVKTETLEQYGAVSEEVAIDMALNIKKAFNTDIAVAVSGLAGPGGETENKKVGTVCFAFALPGRTETVTKFFPGSRETVRTRSSFFAIDYCRRFLSISG